MATNSSQTSSEGIVSASNLIRYGYQNVIEGRRRFAFWIFITILFVLTIGNIFLSTSIIGVLRLAKGMESIETIPQEKILKFRGNVDLDKILYKGIGNIESFEEEGMEILGDDAGVVMKVMRGGITHSRIILDNDSGISIKEVNNFEVKDAFTGNTIFNIHKPQYNFPQGMDNLLAKEVTVKKIASSIEKPMHVLSDGKIYLNGAEGIRTDSEGIFVLSEDDLIGINSTSGSIILSAFQGVALDIDKIPVVKTEYGIRTSNLQYKICVCMPQGLLFRIPISRNKNNNEKISCLSFSTSDDPCQ